MFVVKGPPGLCMRPTHIVIGLIVFCLLLLAARRSSDQHAGPLLKDADIVVSDGTSSAEERYLGRLARDLGLSQQVAWRAWRIVPREQSDEWPSVTEVKLNFDSVTSRLVNQETPDRMDLYAKKRMQLPVPTSPLLGQVDASDFLFGVSTTVARIVDRDYAMAKAWARWLTDGHHNSNGASLVVVLDQATEAELEEVDKVLQTTGIDCWITTTDEPMSMARRYFELSRILKTFAVNMKLNGQDKRWFGLVEDDVFFPSLADLRDRLFAYNTDGQYYIGIPSERLDWKELESTTTTFGGGAILLTWDAITMSAGLPCFESGHSTSYSSKRWDEVLQGCILKHSGINMHVLPGFFSPLEDLLPAEVDSYEMGRQPIVLRRYSERHMLDINKAHLVTNVCGESCFMQRYLFRDGWVLVNGVSLTHYPDGIVVRGPDEDEEGPQQDPLHPEDEEYGGSSYASIPKKTPERIIIDDTTPEDKTSLAWTGRRETWRLMDSATTKDNDVWQAYVKKADNREPNSGQTDSVIVLIWENGKSAW